MSGPFFRTYARDHTWTGYADRPQYPGQAAIPACHCGRPAERLTGILDVRRCSDGHWSGEGLAPILEAIAAFARAFA